MEKSDISVSNEVKPFKKLVLNFYFQFQSVNSIGVILTYSIFGFKLQRLDFYMPQIYTLDSSSGTYDISQILVYNISFKATSN